MYASKLDILEIYGEEFLKDILPEDVSNDSDANIAIEKSIVNASAEIDGYLSARYELPLSSSPAVLKRPCIDITAYVLANRQSRLTDTIETRYEQAIDFLKMIAKGQAGLGKDEPRISTGTGSSVSGSAFSAQKRNFGRGR